MIAVEPTSIPPSSPVSTPKPEPLDAEQPLAPVRDSFFYFETVVFLVRSTILLSLESTGNASDMRRVVGRKHSLQSSSIRTRE